LEKTQGKEVHPKTRALVVPPTGRGVRDPKGEVTDPRAARQYRLYRSNKESRRQSGRRERCHSKEGEVVMEAKVCSLNQFQYRDVGSEHVLAGAVSRLKTSSVQSQMIVKLLLLFFLLSQVL